MGQAQEILDTFTATSATNKALWKCDEASGNLADAGGGANTLTALGTPTYSVTGVEDTAITFDGSSNEGATAVGSPMGTTLGDTWTVGFNIKGSGQTEVTLFALASGGATGWLIMASGDSAPNNTKLRVMIYSAANSQLTNSTTAAVVLDGEWHHVVLVGSGGDTITPYLDGSAQTPISVTWSASRPELLTASIACLVSNISFPEAPAQESAITVDNVFCCDKAFTEQQVLDIYNSGQADVIAPAVASLTISANGLQWDVVCTEVGSSPVVLNEADATGFSGTINGNAVTFDSASIVTNTTIRLVPSAATPPGTALLSYDDTSGNVTDSADTPNAMASFTDQAVTNNSVTATYCEITVLASSSARMAPHTVFATLAAASVPVDGDWRYVSCTWDFGDGSTVEVTNPITSATHNATTDLTIWTVAHIYETAGAFTITATMIDKNGDSDGDTAGVTIVADTRTTKYLDVAADPAGDGSLATPWSTHAEMIAAVADNQHVMVSGTFDLTDASPLPASLNNVWFEGDGTAIFNWTTNPAASKWVFDGPATGENVLIDNIQCTGEIAATLTDTANRGGFVRNQGKSLTMRDCSAPGTAATAMVSSMLIYGPSPAGGSEGTYVENCTFGDSNGYGIVGNEGYYCVCVGMAIGAGYIESTRRFLSDASNNPFKYIGDQWCTFDHDLWIGNGSQAANGEGAKPCSRYGASQYASSHDCVFTKGVVDIGYHNWDADGYYAAHHIQLARCKFDDAAISIRPNTLDVAIASSYFKGTKIWWDIATPEAGAATHDQISILHNDFVPTNTSSTFTQINTWVISDVTHAVTKTNIELDGNIFADSPTGGTLLPLRIDDSDLYAVFSSVKDNIFHSGVSTITQTWNAVGQSVTASQNWATFTGVWADNDQESIEGADLDALTDYRPDAATYPQITSFASARYEGVLQTDMQGNPRLEWYVGAVDIEAAITGAPTNLTAVHSGSSRIDLSWDDNSNNETGFEIYRRQ